MRNLKNKEDESLLEMLMFARVSKLPELLNDSEGKVWVRAIVKILRKSGYYDYAVAYHDYFSWNEVTVTKELAGMGIACEVAGIYPFEYLQDRYLPTVKSKVDIVNYLASVTHDDVEHLSNMPNEQLKKVLYNTCIKEQIHRSKEVEEMKQYKREAIDYGLDFLKEDKEAEEAPHGEPQDKPEEEIVETEAINENIEENGEDGRNDGKKSVGRPKKKVEE